MVERKLKVGSATHSPALAGSIVANFRPRDEKEIPATVVTLEAIGAGAVNQAVKAIIIANGYLSPIGKHIRSNPAFGEVDMQDGSDRTSIVYTLSLEDIL